MVIVGILKQLKGRNERRFVGSRDGGVAMNTIMKEWTASEFAFQPHLRH